jgi:hypothetical protein
MESITVGDIEWAFGEKLSSEIASLVTSANMQYELLTSDERDSYILTVIEELMNPNLTVSGDHRRGDWEKGWGENLTALVETGSVAALIPRYHRKRQILHWRQNVVRAVSDNLDLVIFEILVEYIFEQYFLKLRTIYEFGCGPAYNLLRLRKRNPTAHLVGLDWASASKEIIDEIRNTGIDNNIEGRVFNFFEPDYSLIMPEGSGIYTIAALEQVGDRYEAFIQFLLNKRPTICVHLEPIDELLDPGILVDRLSQLYFRKRNYLRGFLTRLRELDAQGLITIHRQQRTYTGSFFIEGHSLIVWSPK